MRRLIKTFPGFPDGAGIYELDDGSTKFYNCAPGKECVDPSALPDFEGFFEVTNVTTGEIVFVETDPFYKTLKNALNSAGANINDIKTKDQLMHTLSQDGLGAHITYYIQQKWQNRTPTTLRKAMSRALFINDMELYKKLKAKLERRETIGLTRVK